MIYSKYNSNKENNGDNNNNKDNKNKKKKLCPAEDIIKTQNKIIQNPKENIAKNKKPLSLFTQDLFSKHYKHKNNEKKDTKLSLGEIISKKILINASITKKGNKYFDEQKNQDSLFKVKFSDINFSFYGVCDGHGKNGHLVSDFIKINLPIILYNKLKKLINSNFKKDKNEINNINYEKLFQDSFSNLESNIISNKNINIDFSGSTCASLLFSKYSIISANIGDSRAIKGQLINNKWSYEILTRDHKPKEKDEAERIIKLNGDIHPFILDNGRYNGPLRVWIKERNFPGLSMTRVIGDKLFKSIGVSSEPEIKIIPYKNYDKFVIIASDGLWDYVSNNEAVQIVSHYYIINDCDSAVLRLYEIAYNKWINNERYIDDISIIVVFLE